jgi:wobble nucleotide-excising tRNase
MITKISLNKIACYKNNAVIETDKKVNLIYGLNGTGKSILSNFLYNPKESRFNDCAIEGLKENDEILTYNETFIHENFYESENLKGIFTLSKENKDAEAAIAIAEKEISRIDEVKSAKEKEREKEKGLFEQKHEAAKDKIWEIKRNYTGGDRVLEFCMEGYKSDGYKLLAYVESLEKPNAKPSKSIEVLKEEVQTLAGRSAHKVSALLSIIFSVKDIEMNLLFNKQIIGNENSVVSELINKMGSSDWVKDGLKYLPTSMNQDKEACPFCQEKTISRELIENIKNYFDESYDADIKSLNDLLIKYTHSIQVIPDKLTFEVDLKIEPYKKDFEIKYNSFVKIIDENKKLIENKIKSPSVPVNLKSSEKALAELNTIIQQINDVIEAHNKNIEQKESVLEQLKNVFWATMRWDYDQTISSFISDKTAFKKNIDSLGKAIDAFEMEIMKQRRLISEQQKSTVNIDDAINSINTGLVDLGIEDFKIKNHSENLYKIVRGECESRVFQSLSEGEKMIISFLYFLELCRGKKNATDAAKKKIVVIDDPISSLSHIYVFNIGRLIHSEFLRTNKYEQLFVLTHSLYFFYELTDTNNDRRRESQKLFRIRKNASGSNFIEMHYEEIQNDYHAYWNIIKDDHQSPTLIANCMRNIIEYFFNFVEKNDLNKVFQNPLMQEIRFQAFCRYINRESHSLGQNIFDIKEFNYNDFKDAFALVFKENGYEEHYKKMMR